jgi:hypothetical protein
MRQRRAPKRAVFAQHLWHRVKVDPLTAGNVGQRTEDALLLDEETLTRCHDDFAVVY